MNRFKMTTSMILIALIALIPMACGDDDDGGGGSGSGLGTEVEGVDLSGASFTVGSKEFTEQLILGQMTLQMLEASGAEVSDQTGLEGSVAARRALTSGDIDMYWEYTGTGWLSYLKNDEPIKDSQKQYEAVKEADLQQNQIEWLDPAPFDNTYALAVSEDASDPISGVESISDLAELASSDPDAVTMCVGQEFASREDGLPGLLDAYGIEIPTDNVSNVPDAGVYTEVAKGERCNFGSVFATDGKIGANNLRVLEDDKQFFAVYNPALNVSEDVLKENPQLADLFNPLAATLETETMQELNTLVDADGELPEDVARDYLVENGFLAE